MKGKTHTSESINKIKNTLNDGRRKGSGNGMYGKVWINNGSKRRAIKKDDLIPEGWDYGWKLVI